MTLPADPLATSLLGAVDWPNIVATLSAAVLGGWIASRIAQRQMNAASDAEPDKFSVTSPAASTTAST